MRRSQAGTALARNASDSWLSGKLGCRQVNWFQVETQLESLTKLQKSRLPVKLVLPGHGRPGAFQSDEDREAQYADLLERGG